MHRRSNAAGLSPRAAGSLRRAGLAGAPLVDGGAASDAGSRTEGATRGGPGPPAGSCRPATAMTIDVPGWGGARLAAVRRVAAPCAALLLVNASLTFANVWPTLGVRFNRDLSAEAAAGVLLLVALHAWGRRPPRAAVVWLALGWLALAGGRYVEVTVAALYGREVNLYWDLQHVPKVGAMFAFVADPWLKAGFVAGLILAPPGPLLRGALGVGEHRGRGRAAGGAPGARRRRRRGAAARPGAVGRPRGARRRPGGRAGVSRLRARAGRARLRGERGGPARPRSCPGDALGPVAGRRRRRARHLPRVVRGGELGARRLRRGPGPGASALRGGGGRDRPPHGVGPRRVDHLRRRVVARPHQPALGHRGARPRRQRAPDGPGAGHPGEAVRAPRLPHRRAHAGSPGGLARGRVLRLRGHLRPRAARLPRPAVRVVERQRPVLPRAGRRGRDRPGGPPARLRVLRHHHHPCAVRARPALPARLGAGAGRHPLRRGRPRPRVVRLGRLDEPRPELRRGAAVRVRQRRRLPPAAGRPRPRAGAGGRPSAAGPGERRRRLLGTCPCTWSRAATP